MGAKRIYLTGFITIPSDELDVVLAHLPDHIRLSRAEEGCCHFDCEQDADDPQKINVDECFASEVAFKAHQMRTATSAWGDVTKGMTRTFEIKEDF